ncbi:hypothetical protein X975_17830, partial [Stegodyphus mimosarum]
MLQWKIFKSLGWPWTYGCRYCSTRFKFMFLPTWAFYVMHTILSNSSFSFLYSFLNFPQLFFQNTGI